MLYTNVLFACKQLLTLVNERGFLEGREDSFLMPRTFNFSPAEAEVMECVLLLIFGGLVGMLTFVLLRANFEFVSTADNSRRRVCTAHSTCREDLIHLPLWL